MSVGSRIKELRESKNISRSELANLLGVTVGSISNYENEVSSPKESILFKIMEVLHCDANYLFQDAVNMPTMKNNVSIEEHHIVEKYRILDTHGKEMVDFTLDKEYERCAELKTQRPDISKQRYAMSELNAAHERTDIKITNEMKQYDDDIMDDDDF